MIMMIIASCLYFWFAKSVHVEGVKMKRLRRPNCCWIILKMLKEYYEIVDDLSRFFPTHADFFTEMHLTWHHETKYTSKFQSNPSPNCFTIDVWNINCWRQQFTFLLNCFFRRICISFLHEFCSVLTCDILGIGL